MFLHTWWHDTCKNVTNCSEKNNLALNWDWSFLVKGLYSWFIMSIVTNVYIVVCMPLIVMKTNYLNWERRWKQVHAAWKSLLGFSCRRLFLSSIGEMLHVWEKGQKHRALPLVVYDSQLVVGELLPGNVHCLQWPVNVLLISVLFFPSFMNNANLTFFSAVWISKRKKWWPVFSLHFKKGSMTAK